MFWYTENKVYVEELFADVFQTERENNLSCRPMRFASILYIVCCFFFFLFFNSFYYLFFLFFFFAIIFCMANFLNRYNNNQVIILLHCLHIFHYVHFFPRCCIQTLWEVCLSANEISK